MKLNGPRWLRAAGHMGNVSSALMMTVQRHLRSGRPTKPFLLGLVFLYVVISLMPATVAGQTLTILSTNSYIQAQADDINIGYESQITYSANGSYPFQATALASSPPLPAYDISGNALADESSVISLAGNVLTVAGYGNTSISEVNIISYGEDNVFFSYSYFALSFSINSPFFYTFQASTSSTGSVYSGWGVADNQTEVYLSDNQGAFLHVGSVTTTNSGSMSGILGPGTYYLYASLQSDLVYPSSSFSDNSHFEMLLTLSPSNIVATTVAGYITDACTGQPITNATVQIGYLTAMSDVNGYYSKNALPPATYTVIASAANYASVTNTVTTSSLATNITQNFSLSMLSTVPAITLSASPANGGTVSGGGTFACGSSQTVTATANGGYTFVNWTENGTGVSTSASYTFTVTGNETLVANFTTLQSVVFDTPTAIGGGLPAIGTVYLTGPAPASGAVVSLTASTLWPAGSGPNPNVLFNAPATVTVEPGQIFASFTVATLPVYYPTYGIVEGSYSGVLATGSVTVIAQPIGSDIGGNLANTRVNAILQQFIAANDTSLAALSNDFEKVANVRNQCLPGDNPPDHGRLAEQDIYLAAAEHYLFAVQYPWAGTYVVVAIYDIYKSGTWFVSGGSCNLPPSRPTILADVWAVRGYDDWFRIQYALPPIYPYHGN
jgi:hypothetical protein